MSQRNNNRNRNRSSNSTRESLSHPYWHAAAYYFMEALRVSTSTSTSTTQEPPILPSFPPSPSFSQDSSFPLQPPPQNPYYNPNPINVRMIDNNSVSPLNFNTESVNNLANIFRIVSLDYDNVESRIINSLSNRSSSHHQNIADNQSSGTNGGLNFTLESFPYTLSKLERYEIQIRIQGKITSTNVISSSLISSLITNCKDDHKTSINSQGNIYCKKGNNVYHYHNLSNSSFYFKI